MVDVTAEGGRTIDPSVGRGRLLDQMGDLIQKTLLGRMARAEEVFLGWVKPLAIRTPTVDRVGDLMMNDRSAQTPASSPILSAPHDDRGISHAPAKVELTPDRRKRPRWAISGKGRQNHHLITLRCLLDDQTTTGNHGVIQVR